MVYWQAKYYTFTLRFTLSYPIIESGTYRKALNMSLCCILNTKHYSPINAIITQKWGGNQSSCLPVIITPFYQIAYQHPYYCSLHARHQRPSQVSESIDISVLWGVLMHFWSNWISFLHLCLQPLPFLFQQVK